MRAKSARRWLKRNEHLIVRAKCDMLTSIDSKTGVMKGKEKQRKILKRVKECVKIVAESRLKETS